MGMGKVQSSLNRPIAVFDSGIGSFGVVQAIRKALPEQDILYLADRASFPYGGKSRVELLRIIERTIDFLASYEPVAIVVASNAPSILVLDEVKKSAKIPLYGVYPPLREALEASGSGQVGIMGVQSMVESEMIDSFVEHFAENPQNVALINASPMVELVESGAFTFAPEDTQMRVERFLAEVFEKYPKVDVLTLSSTHLPWLRGFFEVAKPECLFLDPVERVIASLGDGTAGSGKIEGFVTESENYKAENFKKLLLEIGADIPIRAVLF
jgi:Glutamate racemase